MDPAQTLPLGGQSAFITGAAKGLGAAIARGLAQAGARVVLADIDAGMARVQARSLIAEGFEALALDLDVRDEAAFQKAFDQAVAQIGPIGLMVNNAALTPTTSIWDIAAREWNDVMAVNLRGCFFGCRIAGRHMREREKGGRILNLSSIAGQQASAATGVHYAATKAGILAITRSFAQALAPDGITVNALAPSTVESAALAALDPQRRHALQASIPLGRFGDAQEVAAAAVYLASPAAAFITGVTLDVNGGRLMR